MSFGFISRLSGHDEPFIMISQDTSLNYSKKKKNRFKHIIFLTNYHNPDYTLMFCLTTLWTNVIYNKLKNWIVRNFNQIYSPNCDLRLILKKYELAKIVATCFRKCAKKINSSKPFKFYYLNFPEKQESIVLHEHYDQRDKLQFNNHSSTDEHLGNILLPTTTLGRIDCSFKNQMFP